MCAFCVGGNIAEILHLRYVDESQVEQSTKEPDSAMSSLVLTQERQPNLSAMVINGASERVLYTQTSIVQNLSDTVPCYCRMRPKILDRVESSIQRALNRAVPL